MKPTIALYVVFAVAAAVIGGKSGVFAAEDSGHYNKTSTSRKIDKEQVPSWSDQDMDFFLHGSMSTEVIPETVLHAFIKTYPDLFPTQNLGHLGLIPDPEFGWPIGFSRTRVKHLGYGTKLSSQEKQDLIEYLKTL